MVRLPIDFVTIDKVEDEIQVQIWRNLELGPFMENDLY